MQICHVLRKEFNPERFDTFAVFAFWIVSILVRVISGQPTHYIGWVAAAVAAVDCFRFAVILSRRIARLLKINILMWTPPKNK